MLYIQLCRLSLLLSTGQFGKVYKAKMQKSQQSANVSITVAVKTVAQITLDFRKEVTIMSEVVHPNIIRLYGLINQGRCLCSCSYLCSKCTLYPLWHNTFQVKWHQQW